jgi:hypothetical protein
MVKYSFTSSKKLSYVLTNILLIFCPCGQNIIKNIHSCSCDHVHLLMLMPTCSWTSIHVVVVFGVMTFALVIITSSAHCQLLRIFQHTPFFSIICLLHLLCCNAGVFSYFCWQIASLIGVVFSCFIFLHIFVFVYISCLHRINMALVFALVMTFFILQNKIL